MRVARGLMNRRAPISGFESPSRESRDVVLMLGELIAGLDGALAGGLAGRGNWRRARSANASTPMPLSMSYAMRSCPRSTGPGGRTRRASGCSSWPNATRTKVGSSLPRHPRDVGVGEPDGDATARPSHPRRPGSCRPWTVPGTPPPRRRDPATVGHLRNAGQLSDLPYSRPAAATSRSSGAARQERWLGRRSGLALPVRWPGEARGPRRSACVSPASATSPRCGCRPRARRRRVVRPSQGRARRSHPGRRTASRDRDT